MIQIVECTFSHLDDLAPLFDAYRVFYRQPSDIPAGRAFLEARMQTKASIAYMAIDSETNTAVGFTQLYPLFSSTRMGRVWLLNDLFVDPDHRGKGISVALIDRAKQLTKESGAVALILETEKTNTIGNQLYPRAGFELETTNHYFWEPPAGKV